MATNKELDKIIENAMDDYKSAKEDWRLYVEKTDKYLRED